MKRSGIIHSIFYLVLAISICSGGLTMYYHFCSSEEVSIQSVTQIDHCGSTNLKENSESCHKSDHNESNSCHSKEGTKKPCCIDEVEFTDNDQVVQKVNKHQFVFVAFIAYYPILKLPTPKQHHFSKKINHPPPLLASNIFASHQQFLF